MNREVNMIVAAGCDGAIGRDGNLIWRIPSDLKRFKRLTMGHPVIMGRKTWESLPKRPLPGRLNIVVTRDPLYSAPGAVVACSPEEALEKAAGGDVSPFIMGGAQLYAAFMPLVTRIWLTEVEAGCSDADARLEWPLDPEIWQVEEAEAPETTPEGITYRYVNYRRK